MTWPKVWTEQLIQDVHALMMLGETAVNVSTKTGFSVPALMGKMQREYGGWGIRHKARIIKETKRPPINEALIYRDDYTGKMLMTDEGRRYLRSAWQRGVFVEEIGATFGVSRNTVMHYRRQLGLKPRGKPVDGAKPAKPKKVDLEPWPDNMPRFDVYERADKVGKRIFI